MSGGDETVQGLDTADMEALFALLNEDNPGLEKVKEAVRLNRLEEALVELKSYLSCRPMPSGFPDRADRDAVCTHIRENCAEELKAVLGTADELLAQTFLFRFPWDMERTNVPVVFEEDIDWSHIPSGDPEWAYMLNRHRYWIALGQAYILTGDERYADQFCLQLEDWIDRNPLPGDPVGSLTWRGIEAGLRGTNWTKVVSYVLDSPALTPMLAAKLLLSLHAHAEYLAGSFSEWKSISNWGVLESCGLLHIACFLQEFRQSEHWAALALERLSTTASLQILPDGMHWEQSPTYQQEVLYSYLEMLHLCHCRGTAPNETATVAIRGMAFASLHSARPDRRQTMTGDSDSSDISSVMAAAALVFGDPVLRFGGGKSVDYDNAWLFGAWGLDLYPRLKLSTPPQLSHAFTYSGNFVMRSGWDDQALYLLLRCAPLGGGHGHADLLHIDVYAYGREMLTDLGRYNYSESEPLRAELKRCTAHNTTIVDNTDFTEITGTWDYGHIANPTCVRWISQPDFDYAEAGHDGYRRLADPVYPRRRILFIKPHCWLLIDSFDCSTEHDFKQYFHFPPGRVNLASETGYCQTDNEGTANLCILPVRQSGLTATLEKSVISYEYNLKEANPCVVYGITGSGTVSMTQLLYPMPPGDSALPVIEHVPVYRHTGEPVEASRAEAFRIVLPGKGDYFVLISHRPPAVHADSYIVAGVQVFGEVVLIDPGKREGRVTVVK